MIQEAECANMLCASFWCLTCICSECGCATAPEQRKRLYIELIEGGSAEGMPPQQQTMGGASARAPLLNTSPRQSGSQPGPASREAVAKLFAIMRESQANVAAQEKACETLACWAHSAANTAKIVELGGLEVLIATMRKHRSNVAVQKNGCRALFNLTMNDVKIAEPGGIEVVLAAMTELPVIEVQERGCPLLCKLASESANKTKIVELGGIEVLLATMRVLQTEKLVQETGLITLGMIVTGNDALMVKMAELGGLEVVLAALRAHLADMDVRKNAFMVLADLSSRIAIGLKIVELGGLEVVLAATCENQNDMAKMIATTGQLALSGQVQQALALRANLTNLYEVHELPCQIFRNLAIDDASKVKIAFSTGGLEVLFMKLRSGDQVVQAVVCDALRKLTENKEANARIAVFGGLEILLAKLEEDDCAVVVQHPLCAALSNLVANDANSAKIAELGGREVLLATIRTHQPPKSGVGQTE